MKRHLKWWAWLLPLLVGCGGPVVVSGSVSYDGKPVEDGYITFTPDKGQGKQAGEAIKDGKYSVKGLTPGKYTVVIVGNRWTDWPKDTPAERKTTEKMQVADLVPAEAEGNGKVVEVGEGGKTLDFELKRPPG